MSTSGVYHVDVESEPQSVATGDLIAVGKTRLIANGCDDQMRCEYILIDHSSGARTPIDLAAVVASTTLAESELDLANRTQDGLTPGQRAH